MQGVQITNSTKTMLEAALEYAAKGWRVFPCLPGGKAPMTTNGFHDATTDTNQIQQWWSRWPDANVAVALDSLSLFVIDIDPRNGGSTPIGLPETLTTLTGGGGEHYYFSYSPLAVVGRDFRKIFAQGVDIKTDGGYVLLPPSTTTTTYRWQDSNTPISEAPDWLLEAVLKPKVDPKDYSSFYDDPTDTRPGTEYNRHTTWEELLEPLGWKVIQRNIDGETYWCRPGKSEGISATTGYQGADVLYVFSSSTELESGKAYTKFGVLTLCSYAGDYSAASAALAQGVGQRIDVTSLPDTKVQMSTVAATQKAYTFEPAFHPGSFVSSFIEYVQSQTDSPSEYAEAGALILLSVAGYQCKAALAPYPGGLRNNLYVTLVGPTTRSRKSTVQRITTDIVRAVMPPAPLPNRATTEALIKALSSRSGVPSLWAPDEFGVTLAEIYNRDFMKGLEEMLLTVYSGDDYEYQRVMDTVTIRQPHLSVLAAATPESISRAGTTALDSGLLPRFAVVYPSTMPESRAVQEASDLRIPRQALISRLTKILQWSNTNREIKFDPPALVLLNTAEQNLTTSSGARLPTMLYKVAALSAISDERNLVGPADATSAITVVQRWADGMSSLVPQMYRHGTDQQFEQQLDYVLGELKKAGGSLHRTEIANLINVKKQRLDEIESTLHDKGKINVETSNGKTWTLL